MKIASRLDLLSIALFATLSGSPTECASKARESSFDVTASLGHCSGSALGLVLHLSNASGADLEIYAANLPSGGDDVALQLRAVDSHNEPLLKLNLVRDPSDEIVSIPSGEGLTGCIDLARYFRDIRDIHARDDIDVFWSYELRALDGEYSRFSGRVRVPRRQTAQQPAMVQAGVGRYTQADPVGVVQLGEPDLNQSHINLFNYVGGRPLNFVDPLGLKACASGKCADSPSGVWTTSTMTDRIFFQ